MAKKKLKKSKKKQKSKKVSVEQATLLKHLEAMQVKNKYQGQGFFVWLYGIVQSKWFYPCLYVLCAIFRGVAIYLHQYRTIVLFIFISILGIDGQIQAKRRNMKQKIGADK